MKNTKSFLVFPTWLDHDESIVLRETRFLVNLV